MDLGVTSVPEGIESSGPRCDPPRECQNHQSRKADQKSRYDKRLEKELELFSRNELSNNLYKRDELEKTKDTQGRHVFGCSDGQELDKRNLH